MKSKDLKILRKKLTKANRIDNDPLSGFSKEDLTLELSDEVLKLNFYVSSSLPDARLAECLALFETNMGEFYKNSSWGLDMTEKAGELKHKNARFLLLLGEGSSLAGFVHFRFEYDDEEHPSQAVVYVYEIQIDKKYRRQGLGKKIMAIIEEIAQKAAMPKVMLTCLKSNKAASGFYQGLEYTLDETDPSNFNEPVDYEILSRKLNAISL